MKKSILFIRYLFFIFILMCSYSAQSQCAMCRSTVESNAKVEVTNRAESLNTGILYLMIIPYLLFATLAYFWYKNSKKARLERQKIDDVLKKAI
ncbi:MAG: hypothetical protein EAZ53_02660 [Bacteroidetes bacterium]|nr:MAG: hypothetical protein EAZ53_02660 [Bacteroidota bacterium]